MASENSIILLWLCEKCWVLCIENEHLSSTHPGLLLTAFQVHELFIHLKCFVYIEEQKSSIFAKKEMWANPPNKWNCPYNYSLPLSIILPAAFCSIVENPHHPPITKYNIYAALHGFFLRSSLLHRHISSGNFSMSRPARLPQGRKN